MATSEVKVGAFALSGAAILAGMISFMGAFSLGRGGYELLIDYPQVSGLMSGHEVRYAGVKVGSVKKINVSPDKVEVVAEIDDNIKIPEGASFSIGADGILGEKFVSVLPPVKVGQSFIAQGATVKGTAGGGMDDLMANSGGVMNRLDNIASAFENIFGDKDVQESLKASMKNMAEISKNMNDFTKVMADVAVANQSDISNIAKQMNLVSQRMAAATGHLESMAAGIDANGKTGRNIANMAEHMASTTKRMENIVAVLEKVAQDPVTSQSLQDTLINVKETSAKANKIMGTFSNAEFKLDAGSSLKDKDWRGSMGVNLRPTNESFAYIGAYDIGDKNKMDFIVGRKFGDAGFSMGAMQGDFGVGLSYDFGNSFRVYSQLYDFDDAKVRVGGEVKLHDNFSFYGESMNVRGTKKDTYLGVRTYF